MSGLLAAAIFVAVQSADSTLVRLEAVDEAGLRVTTLSGFEEEYNGYFSTREGRRTTAGGSNACMESRVASCAGTAGASSGSCAPT